MVTILSPLRLSLHTLGTSGLCFLSVSSICLFSTCVASLPHAQRRDNEQQAVFRVSPSRRVVGQRPRSLARRLQSRSAAKSSAARPVRFISFLFFFHFPLLGLSDVSVYPWSVDSRRIDGLGPVASLPCSGPMSAGTTDEVQSRATCQCFNLSLKEKIETFLSCWALIKVFFFK